MFERIMSNRRANTSTERSVAAKKPRSSASKVPKDVTVAAPDAKTKTIVCFHCREEGHLVRDCSKPDERRCHRCKQEGHTVRNCPVKNETVNSSLDVDGAEELRGFTGSKDMSITTLGSTYPVAFLALIPGGCET